ncbi:hypothetical protein BD770DRAFT_382099 [Pilaira anomala]|nr:hypothetical protein BD770DRAFT_382099 [Pilaira anomala]
MGILLGGVYIKGTFWGVYYLHIYRYIIFTYLQGILCLFFFLIRRGPLEKVI